MVGSIGLGGHLISCLLVTTQSYSSNEMVVHFCNVHLYLVTVVWKN